MVVKCNNVWKDFARERGQKINIVVLSHEVYIKIIIIIIIIIFFFTNMLQFSKGPLLSCERRLYHTDMQADIHVCTADTNKP